MLLRKHFLNIKMSEKLCLQWNDFQENIKIAFGNLREDKDFKDVTLVSEDGQQVEVHKVILAASSPFFQNLFVRSKHPHPLIYMRGVKFEDISAIVDFLYCGEANVFQESLDSFLAIAQELQLKGLMGKTDEDLDVDKKCPPPHASLNDEAKISKSTFKKELPGNKNVLAEYNAAVALPSRVPSHYSGDVHQLEEMVKSMMEKSDNKCQNHNQRADKCKVCGKEGKGNAIKDHIEANHIEGIVLPCDLCQKTFRSRHSLSMHNRRHHNRLS